MDEESETEANEKKNVQNSRDVDPAEFFVPHPRMLDVTHPGFSSALLVFCEQIWNYSIFTCLSSVFFPLRLEVAHWICDSIFQPRLRIPTILTYSVSALGILNNAFREHQYPTDFDLANSIRISSEFRNLVIFLFTSISYVFGVNLLDRHAEKYWRVLGQVKGLACRGYGIPAILLGLALPICGSETVAVLHKFHRLLTDVICFPLHSLRIPEALIRCGSNKAKHLLTRWRAARAYQILKSLQRASKNYEYDTLSETAKEFRLMKIQVGIFSTRCELVTVPEPDGIIPAYEAVSWRWDGPEKLKTLNMNGKILNITQRVSEIIQKLTPLYGKRYLWIDSICINQDDTGEKSSQIQLMSQLYRNATRVIAYLGDADNAFLIPGFVGRLDAAALQRIDPTIFKQTDPLDRFPYSNEVQNWTALQDLFRHPFWSRIWIIQEITLAKSVTLLYGTNYLQFDLLSRVAQSFVTDNPVTRGPILSMNNFFGGDRLACLHGRMNVAFLAMAREIYSRNNEVPLSQVLQQTRAAAATDDRDRLYGLQALDPILRTPELTPDYNISVERLYTNLARHSLKNGSFSLFCLAGLDAKSSLAIPSWVPDLTSIPTKQAIHDADCQYSVTGTTTVAIDAGADQVLSTTIKLRGLVLDRLLKIDRNNYWTTILALPDDVREETLRGVLRDGHGTDLRPGLRQWLESVVEMVRDDYGMIGLKNYKTGGPLLEAVLRTMIADRDSVDFPASSNMIEFMSRYISSSLDVDLTSIGGRVADSPLTAEDNAKAMNLGSLWVKATAGRQVALTDTGYMCLVPESAECGDTVCVFLGSKVPYVIRKMKTDHSWQLVGEGYVHGIMDGKSITNLLLEENMLEWIELQ